MLEESACFDPNLQEHFVQQEDDFSNTNLPNCNNNQSFSINEQSYPQNQQEIDSASAQLEMELQQQLNLEMEQCYNNNNNNNIQELVHDSNWNEMSHFDAENQYNQHHQIATDNIQNVQNQSFSTAPYPITPDLLNMFPLPMCPNSSSITFSNSVQNSSTFLASLGLLGDLSSVGDGSSGSGSVVYDPLLPLNLPPQPPLLRELFHSLPNGSYAFGGGKTGSLFGGVDERDFSGRLYQESGDNNNNNNNNNNGVFEFTAGDMDSLVKNRDGKDTKHSERHRRVLLNDKYGALRRLIPSPTKTDRASIVGDAINYINELKRTVNELKIWVEKKRCARERLKRPKTEDDAIIEGNDSKSLGDMDHPANGSSLRSSWLHRKSKNSEVDVRIVDDEVTVKIIQQKRINGLILVSRVLDELQLDLHHVAGGLIGDYYSFLFNSKICEGSIVYASAIANKIIDVVDKQYAALPPTCRL